MAAGSAHRVMIGKTVSQVFLVVFDRILLIHAGNKETIESLDEFEHGPRSKLPLLV